MSLHGLLDAVVRDPALAEAVKAAADGNRHARRPRRPAGRPALRRRRAGPLRRAARCSPSPRPAGRPRTSPPRCARCCRPEGVVEYPSWETLPHERLSPALRHRRPPARRAAPAGAPRARDDPAAGPVSVVVAPVRSVLQPQVKGLGDLEPVALRQRAERRPGRGRGRAGAPPRTRGSSWSRSAASSPCAAASSTSSRPPRSTRSGWSSGATRSRRSATSRSPTSAPWRSPSTACGRRRAGSCC